MLHHSTSSPIVYSKTAGVRILVSASLWWSFTGADSSSWVVGAPASILVTILSLFWLSPQRISLFAGGRLVLFFLVQSLMGACDVSSRVSRRSVRIQPEFITYRSQLPSNFSQQLFMFLANLLPGTLIADLQSFDKKDGASMTVHVLSGADQVPAQLKQLEYKVEALFGINNRHV